jgi:hydroxyethylthiazole kinase
MKMNELGQEAAAIVETVRQTGPLIHCMTNHVTVNDCANVLLAVGASPAMIDSADEAFDFAQMAGCLSINIGTLFKEQELAMTQAVLGAKKAGRPIVIDPVACSALPRRAALVERLAQTGGRNLAIIKGNMAEIMALAGGKGGGKGVDSDGDMAGIEEAARAVAQKYGCVVAATGKRDVVTDGKGLVRLCNGHELLTRITGAGCMAGALCAATAAASNNVHGSMFAAAVAGISMMSIAGELAAEKANLPGSFRVALIDTLYTLNGETLLKRIRIEEAAPC